MTEAHTQIPTDAVIVGLDGSERDATCLAWAAGAATRARKPLHLIHARETTGVTREPFTLPWRRRAVAAFLFPG